MELARYENHTIEVVVDRLVKKPDMARRLTDSLEAALTLADGVAEVEMVPREGEEPAETLTFSQHLACPVDGKSYDELAPRNFSFNSPYGACERCDGLGTQFEVDPNLVVPDQDLTLADGALLPWATGHMQYHQRLLESTCEEQGIPFDQPWSSLSTWSRRSCASLTWRLWGRTPSRAIQGAFSGAARSTSGPILLALSMRPLCWKSGMPRARAATVYSFLNSSIIIALVTRPRVAQWKIANVKTGIAR